MSLSVRPLQRHQPGYPRFVEVEDWRMLLEPTAQSVFSRRTLRFAGILGVSLLLATPACAKPALTGQNAAAVAYATSVLDTVPKGSWSKRASHGQRPSGIQGNPDLRVATIPVSFGNSYTGVIDRTRTIDVTKKLFQLYGIQLESGHRFEKQGVSFEADGFDPARQIGFELQEVSSGWAPATIKQDLDNKEQQALSKLLASEPEDLFVAPLQRFPVMDRDAYPASQAYLQSVLDYLDWLKLQGRL